MTKRSRIRRQIRSANYCACALLFVTLWASMAFTQPPEHAAASRPASQRTLLIAYGQPLEAAAKQWADYRRSAAGGSWHVVLHAAEAAEELDAQRIAIQSAIRKAYADAAPQNDAQFAVLLLGDAEPVQAGGIPPWKFPQHDPVMQGGHDFEYITDHPYQLISGAGFRPDFALGRIPARTTDEAIAALSKIKAYETPSGAPTQLMAGRNRIIYTAGEGRFGVMDNLLETLFKEMVDRMVPDAFDMSMTYVKASSIYCPPPSKLTSTVLDRMSDGALLFNYIGHGHSRGFDSLHWASKRFPILRTADLKNLPLRPKGQLPIAFFSACSTGYFDMPKGEQCLAEALLFHPAGPVGIVAGSRITHPYANTILQMDITKSLLVERQPTLGLLDLRATQSMLKLDEVDRELDTIAAPIAFAGKWKTGLMGLRQMHVQLYNLIGDPAMRLALPDAAIENLNLVDGQITGSISSMKRGKVFITLETARVDFAEPAKLLALVGDNDPELEAKAANNYPLVNDRVVTKIEADVIDGAFSFHLKEPLAVNVAMIRAYACGTNEQGLSIDAIGGLRMQTPAASMPTAQTMDTRPTAK